MSLFSFYREVSSAPSPGLTSVHGEDDHEYDEQYDISNIDFHRYPPVGYNLTTYFGTPRLRPARLDLDGLDLGDNFSLDGFEIGRRESVATVDVEGELVTVGEKLDHRISTAPTLCQKAGPQSLPVELWEMIFQFVRPDADDDTFPKLHDLLHCALACRVWAMIALPMLYRTHGFGVLMPKPGAHHGGAAYWPVSRCLDIVEVPATLKMLQLWRTIILSCFTASRPTSPSRFATSKGATLFPYVKYIDSLDARTLVMVLSAITQTQTPDESRSLDYGLSLAEQFFAGAMVDFEISGKTRGERMIVDGPEYRMMHSRRIKDIQLFVGDTALMIMDFIYPHLHHLRSFTIPELGQLRAHRPITMNHPVSLLKSLSKLTSLVISSGWMLSTGLGKAIAQVSPTISTEDGSTNRGLHLTILNWRHKTYYDPNYGGNTSSAEDYRYTVRGIADFFNAINENCMTSLDIDFYVRHNQAERFDFNDVPIAVRQARSLRAARLAHLVCNDEQLKDIIGQLTVGGFRPRAFCLDSLYNSSEGVVNRERWEFNGFFDECEYLELVRFSGMFDIAMGAVRRRPPSSHPPHSGSLPSRPTTPPSSPNRHIALPQPIKTLKLTYNHKQLRESASESFILFTIPALSATLATLKLVDTDHDLISPVRPRRRTRYDAIYDHIQSPLESLIHLQTLTLTGDISAFLIGSRLPQIVDALKDTLVHCDLCFSTLPLSLLERFLKFKRLQTLILREWKWDVEDEDPRARYFGLAMHTERKLRVEEVKGFWERGRMMRGRDGRVMLGLKNLGISGGFLEVAGEKSWAEVRRWAESRGGRFWWNAREMPKVG